MNDLKFAFRQLLKNPGFTAVAVLTLALGIGANTAIFSAINSLFLRPLPVGRADQLVQVATQAGSAPVRYDFSYPEYRSLRERSNALSGLFAASSIIPWHRMTSMGSPAAGPEYVRGQGVTGNFFDVLRVAPLLGRTFNQADDAEGNPQPVVVISHNYWQRRFASDPSVIGAVIKFDDVPVTIVGVTPSHFFGFQPGGSPDVWWPLQLIPQLDHDPESRKLKAGYDSYRLIGRLESNSQRLPAEAEINLAFQRYRSDQGSFRTSDKARQTPTIRVLSASAGWTELQQPLSRPLRLLMAAVGLVLLIACANIAGMTLARGAARTREFAVRSALGAPRRRLIRQSLTESLLLAFLGGVLGLVVAHWGTRMLLVALPHQNGAATIHFATDVRVLGFTAGLCLLTGVLFGLIPAFRNSGVTATTALRGYGAAATGSRSRNRWLNGLVVTQVALSMTLLMGAGLFIRTLKNLRSETRFETEHLVQFGIGYAFAERPSPPQITGKLKGILSRLKNAPGVESASLYLFGLMSGNGYTKEVLPEGYTSSAGEDLSCRGVMGGPGIFETLRIRLVSGRDFIQQDESQAGDKNPAGRRVAVINQSMAKKYFGDANPLGRQFHFRDQADRKYEIVGVVADVKYGSLRQETPPTFYLPFFQQAMGGPISFVLRTKTDPHAVMPGLQTLVAEIDPAIVVQDVRTMDEVVNDSVGRERLVARLGGFFGVFALALAALGLYGVLSFAVVQRTREIAVRVALGAQNRNIRSQVFGQGLKLVVLGLIAGLAGAVGAIRFASGLLYGVSATDPMTAAYVSLLFVGVAALAGWLPARRAVNVDPMRALKEE